MLRIFVLSLAMMSAFASPAWAHKVIASVYASGDQIEGEIGFSNGDMAVNAKVEVTDDQGNTLGEATTDDQGVFTFMPIKAVPHLFRADLGAGHVAEARMEVADLPPRLHQGTVATATPAATMAQPSGSRPAVLDDGQTEVVAEMIRREIKPLRHEIAAYKEKNDLQTILGGIGYIVGVFGIGFYLSARRRLKAAFHG